MKRCAIDFIVCGNARGFSLLEMLVTLMMSAVLGSIAISNLKQLDNPLQNGTALLTSFLKESRAKAISQTVAYLIEPASSTVITTSYATSCSSATFTNDPSLTLELPNTTHLSDTSWSVCFTSRGLTSQNATIAIQDGSNTRTIEVMLGGGIREL